ncbi:MAG: quinolinate synthase NadA, partial [Planctomycetes bacterium]|nr:quinolinate synthase NadA [Planctomycetota bacterium]
IFVPDKNLGQYVMEALGRELLLWPGYCPTHVQPPAEELKKVQSQHPDAVTLAHPECNKEIRLISDELLSTGGMLGYVRRSKNKEFIIATEKGIIHTLQKQNPDKEFYPASQRFICPNMKKITLEKVLFSLEDMKYKITVDEDIAEAARGALERMINIAALG